MKDLGRHFGGDLYQAEVEYLLEHEWAMYADDVLFRRTKLGIKIGAGDRRLLSEFIEQYKAGSAN